MKRLKRSRVRSHTWRVVVATLVGTVLVMGGTPVAAADDDVPRKETCPPGQMTRLESKTCPERPTRPALVLKRACCTKTSEKGTKTRCKSFPHCPSHSPS
jgi:hypothetical protein